MTRKLRIAVGIVGMLFTVPALLLAGVVLVSSRLRPEKVCHG